MTNPVLRQIPNALTTMRLFLAVPICLLILDENYSAVLWVALLAGVSDGVDGWLARKLDATSRYGAIVDPLADKVMLGCAYACFALVDLLPWWVVAVVLGRDIVIVGGALAYHWRFGSYDMAPSTWGKFSTFVQILLALMLVSQQVQAVFDELLLASVLWCLVLTTLVSGGHYVFSWGSKAWAQRERKDSAH
jgi:cardiolipin synthase